MAVGFPLGSFVGDTEGATDGLVDGRFVGYGVGDVVGDTVGWCVGAAVDGETLGVADGGRVHVPQSMGHFLRKNSPMRGFKQIEAL